MCGILGGWTDNPLPPEAVAAALEALVHRGPDDSGQYVDPPVVLAMRRLSIIDLEGGHQPISNEDGTIWVISNGEIYNYVELVKDLESQGHTIRTSSDTEVLVHLYEQHGTEMCHHLRGMYAFAIWDSRKRILLVARDRFGQKPLYCTRTADGGLLFASELKGLVPLIRCTGAAVELDPQAIYDYLSLGYVPQPSTVYRGVTTLPPASWMTFDGNHLVTRSYWSLEYGTHNGVAYPDALERVRALISESVKLRLRSDVPYGVFLSGGVDSSVVAYEASRYTGSSLRTFTVGTGDPTLDESAIAARTAKVFGVQNTVLPLHIAPLEEIQNLARYFDQPFNDSGAILGLAISRLARQHVTVALSGDGGDEVFGGYRRYMAARIWDRFGWIPGRTIASRLLSHGDPGRRTMLGFGKRLVRGMHLSRGARYLVWTSDMLLEEDKKQHWKGPRMRPTEDWIESVIPPELTAVDTQMYGDHQVNLLSDQLVKSDICTMAASLEGRAPLLDHRVAEFVVGQPSAVRLHRMHRKSLLRDAYRGRIPDEVLDGRKRGFETPMESWLARDLKEVFHDSLGSPEAKMRGFVDDELVDGILNRSVLRDRNWSYLAYGSLLLELWLREIAR